VAIAAGEPIASIKEKSGLLDVHIFTREAAKFPRLHELRQASASICEICGEPGTLAYHQVRCEDHQGWRTSSPFPPDQRGYIEACEWEEAPPAAANSAQLRATRKIRRTPFLMPRTDHAYPPAVRPAQRVQRFHP